VPLLPTAPQTITAIKTLVPVYPDATLPTTAQQVHATRPINAWVHPAPILAPALVMTIATLPTPLLIYVNPDAILLMKTATALMFATSPLINVQQKPAQILTHVLRVRHAKMGNALALTVDAK